MAASNAYSVQSKQLTSVTQETTMATKSVYKGGLRRVRGDGDLKGLKSPCGCRYESSGDL